MAWGKDNRRYDPIEYVCRLQEGCVGEFLKRSVPNANGQSKKARPCKPGNRREGRGREEKRSDETRREGGGGGNAARGSNEKAERGSNGTHASNLSPLTSAQANNTQTRIINNEMKEQATQAMTTTIVRARGVS
jgi:hypothetical protein